MVEIQDRRERSESRGVNIQKKTPLGVFKMAGTTRPSWIVHDERQFQILTSRFHLLSKLLQPPLTIRSNSGRFKTTCCEFSPFYSTAKEQKNKPDKRTYFLLMAGLTLQGSNSLKDIITTLIPLKLRKYAI